MELPPDPPGDFGFFTEGASQALNPGKRTASMAFDYNWGLLPPDAQAPASIRAVRNEYGLRQQPGSAQPVPSLFRLAYDALGAIPFPSPWNNQILDDVLDRADEVGRQRWPGYIQVPDAQYTTSWHDPHNPARAGTADLTTENWAFLGYYPGGVNRRNAVTWYPDGPRGSGGIYGRMGGFLDNPSVHGRMGGNIDENPADDAARMPNFVPETRPWGLNPDTDTTNPPSPHGE